MSKPPTADGPVIVTDGGLRDVIVRIADGKLAARDFGGAGIPALLLHGGGRTLADWLPIVAALVPHMRVVAFDLRGHGRSSAASKHSFVEAVADVAAVAAHFDLDRPLLVGHSYGGVLAALYASAHSVRGVVNIDGKGALALADAQQPNDRVAAAVVADALAERLSAAVDTTAAEPQVIDGRVLDELADRAAAALGCPGSPLARTATLREWQPTDIEGRYRRVPSTRYLAAMWLAMCAWDVRELYDALDCPVLVVTTRTAGADGDANSVEAVHRGYDDSLDRMGVAHAVLKAGHLVMWERPEELADLIVTQARSVGGDRPGGRERDIGRSTATPARATSAAQSREDRERRKDS